MRKSILAVAGLCLLVQPAFAARTPSQEGLSASLFKASQSANINQGNLSVTGTAAFNGMFSNAVSTYVLSPQVEYFVVNRLSLGAATSAAYMSGAMGSNINASSLGLAAGPSATYYFLDYKQMSFYGNATWKAFSYTSTNTSVGGNNSGNTSGGNFNARSLGVSAGGNYNFVQWFGMGPQVSWNWGQGFSGNLAFNFMI